MKVAILGTGSVGQAIGKGLLRAGHEVRFGSRTPGKASLLPGSRDGPHRDVAAWGDVVVIAVPYSVAADLIRTVGADTLRGKTVVDATNAIGRDGGLAVGFTTSAAEEYAKLAPGAKFVKAFNTVFARFMSTGKIGDDRVTLFVAADDAAAKQTVMRLGSDIGFDAIDAGPLRSARYLEPMAMELMTIAFAVKMGANTAFRVVRA